MEKWSTFTTETNKDTTLNNHRYTHGEELANTLSHGAGILLGIIAGYFLLIKAAAGNDPHWAVACVSVYLAGMLSSYISSTWYHASAPGRRKNYYGNLITEPSICTLQVPIPLSPCW